MKINYWKAGTVVLTGIAFWLAYSNRKAEAVGEVGGSRANSQ